jgi:hypothetical protein
MWLEILRIVIVTPLFFLILTLLLLLLLAILLLPILLTKVEISFTHVEELETDRLMTSSTKNRKMPKKKEKR